MDQDRLNQLALHCIPGIGSVTIRQLLAYCGSAEAVWGSRKGRLFAIPGIGPATYALLQKQDQAFKDAENIQRAAESAGIELLMHSDPQFPSRLKHIPDAPSLLYYRGNTNLNSVKILSIVGTRRSTKYGADITCKLIHDLKPFNPLIISGLAYGIDILAHRTALQEKLHTVAVLAGGLDRIYPSDHIKIAHCLTDQGGLLSEHPPGTVSEAHRFPARNRIIAGISDGVIVVEAREKGGALITARLANDYDREVFTFPGSVNAAASAGCHKLIKRNQAHLVTSAMDIIGLMGWSDKDKNAAAPAIDIEGLPVTERRIFSYLSQEIHSRSIDQICWSTNLTIYEAATALLQLEFKGLIHALPGKQYRSVYPNT